MNTITTAQLVSVLTWRYATKVFDPSRRISGATWAALEDALVLSPSSFGLQPWRFLVVRDPALRAKLRPLSWDQSQVTDASHFVVFLARTEITAADISRFLERTAEVRGQPVNALAGYRQLMEGALLNEARKPHLHDWAARQTYIAMGQLMTAAAVLGIDTCPMEGFVPAKVDELLGLGEQGLTAAVLCPAGYRSADDRYASLPKVRYAASTVIEHR